MKKVVAYTGALIYAFFLSSIVITASIFSILLASIVGVVLFFSFYDVFYSEYFTYAILILTVLVILYRVFAGFNVERFHTHVEFGPMTKYREMALRLARKMDLDTSKIKFTLSSSDIIAAFAYKRGFRKFGIVLGKLIMEFPDDEAEAILAHELAHIKNGDLIFHEIIDTPYAIGRNLIGLYADVIKETIRIPLAGWFYALIIISSMILLLPFYVISFLVTRLLSRKAEYNADSIAAKYTSPQSLANALIRYEKLIEKLSSIITECSSRTINPKMIPVDISSYLKRTKLNFWHKLYYMFISTHPPTKARIERLLKNIHRKVIDYG